MSAAEPVTFFPGAAVWLCEMCADLLDPVTPWGPAVSPRASAERGLCQCCRATGGRVEYRAIPITTDLVEDLLS